MIRPANIKKYWFIFQTQILNNLAYPLDLLSRSISIVLFMWIFIQLWRVTYGENVEISGLSLNATMWYLVMTETITLSKPRLANTIATAVKDGSIAYLLNKPYNFLLYHLSLSFGDISLRFFMNALAGSIIVWLYVGPPPTWYGILLILPAVVFALLIDFCLTAFIGLLAFLTEEITAFEWIYSKFILILGGVLIPLDFFPAWLQKVALALPFAYTTYGPARLFIEPDLSRLFLLLLQQLGWVLGLSILLTLFYQHNIKQLSVNGG